MLNKGRQSKVRVPLGAQGNNHKNLPICGLDTVSHKYRQKSMVGGSSSTVNNTAEFGFSPSGQLMLTLVKKQL